MPTQHYTENDYYTASLTRCQDLDHLRKNQQSMIFSIYCAGVSIECMFRAYIVKYTREFDSKHDLEKLYAKSLLASQFDDSEMKEQLTIAVKRVNQVWSNDMRYSSEKRMKRLIAHKNVTAGFKDVNKYIERYYSDIFEATELIIKKGKEKWT